MDKPFDTNSWMPTLPWDWEPWTKPNTMIEIRLLMKTINEGTRALHQNPYDPRAWLRRAKTLARMRYPELAVGDAHKASLLIHKLLYDMDTRPNSRIGYKMGFWMQDPEADCIAIDEEHNAQQEALNAMQCKADKIISENLCFAPCLQRGKHVPAPYPWMKEKHRMRSDDLIDEVNVDFADPANGASGGVTCLVKRSAFGHGIGSREGRDLLGVFAARDIDAGILIIADRSRTWGCNGPGRDGFTQNLFGGEGCMDPMHPNMDVDDSAHDMRWIRDRCGQDAKNVLLRCRFLLCCVQDGISHPLDHPLVARMTATYRASKAKHFDYENEIVVVFEALQEFGIDIFANHNFDTWIIFVLGTRIDTNSWSDPNTACLNSLFALFNHSCEPNVAWQTQNDHRTMHMTTKRRIQDGEQLFVEYDSYMNDKSLEERRKRLRRWLDGPCQCTRCVREEVEMSRTPSPLTSSFGSSGWDTDEKPVLPEDIEGKLERCDSLTSC